MSFQLTEEDQGRTLIVHATGKLVEADYAWFVPEFDRRVRQHGKLRVLFDLTGLHGWDASAAWDDLKFGLGHEDDITRLAIVGEKKWHHAMAIVCKPFTKAAVHYFDHTDSARARAWLAET
ncbi:MAG: STAS/SEC14 domain-containing protein [Opitutaceae bacterium]